VSKENSFVMRGGSETPSMPPFDIGALAVLDDDYADILGLPNNPIRIDQFYIWFGQPKIKQGWILHLTVIPVDMKKLMVEILPELMNYEVPFKIVRSRKIHEKFNAGLYGKFKIGKNITIYLDDESKIEAFTRKLISRIGKFSGPEVFTDFKIHGIVYTRYGSFVPNIQYDQFGNRVKIIKDGFGEYFLDKYYTPPIIPPGVANPFESIVKDLPSPPHKRIIANKYLMFKRLKSDAKGDVWKALYFNNYLMLKWCVIKQARRGMFPDSYGRDARDRLAWQYHANKALKKAIPTPAMIEYLDERDHALLIMEYIKKPKDLMQVVIEKLNKRAWFDQNNQTKIEVISYLLKVVEIVKVLHENKHIHRDITAANFILGDNQKIFAIDLELIYSVEDNLPLPPFGIGTDGYVSPAQERGIKLPSYKDDIYSLGALMVMVFASGINPHKIIGSFDRLSQKLNFFVRDDLPVKLMTSCLSISEDGRPDIETVYDILDKYLASLKTSNSIQSDPIDYKPNTVEIDKAIVKGLNSLASESMTFEKLWFSFVDNQFGEDVYPLHDKHVLFSLYRGVGGVIWLLGKLKCAGFNLDEVNPSIYKGAQLITSELTSKLRSLSPSMYYGKAGLAIVLSEAIKNQFLPDSIEIRENILNCFLQNSYDKNILYGTSGQGIAAISCDEFIEKPLLDNILSGYSKNIIEEQRKDGSWLYRKAPNSKEEINNGFGYGISGIAYYLLEYGKRYSDESSFNAAERALNYLQKISSNNVWPNSNHDHSIGRWWCNGTPGIALVFLKSYELTKNINHLKIAERALDTIPKYIVHHKISQCHGVSGLGEIYLEAHRITKKEKWLERAGWISSYLLNYLEESTMGSATWLVDGSPFPTADFMVGNTGIMYYLLRFSRPDMFGFPFFPK
jgi:serine/threonine protein kinase